VAREKAGIFRPGRLALTTERGGMLGVLRAEAARVGADLVEVAPSAEREGLSPLAGAHQRENVVLGVAAACAMAALDMETVRRGVAATRWPGRLQTIPRPGARPLLVDGAHNPAGAAAVAAHLDAAGLAGRVDLVFGALSDKAVEGMFAPLAKRAGRVVLVAPDSPRAIPPETLAAASDGRTSLAPPRSPRPSPSSKERRTTPLYSSPGRSSSPARPWRSSSAGTPEPSAGGARRFG
jgi:Folylpolyglutamate synthase